jgi:hypothetical protein
MSAGSATTDLGEAVLKKPNCRTTLSSGHRPVRGWRSWVAWCAAVALILPSVALLPAVESEAAHVHSSAGHGEHAGAAGDGRLRLADVPGSPTHPVNHDCTPCQVIKYLTASVLPQPGFALSPWARKDAPPSDGRHPPREIVRVTVSPPIRAPPSVSL